MKKVFPAVIVMFLLVTSIPVSGEGVSIKQSVVEKESENCTIKVITPYFEGFEGADNLNRLIRNSVLDSVGEANTTAKALKEYYDEYLAAGGEPRDNAVVTLDTNYCFSRSGDILSLQLSTCYYSGGAHLISWINAITANTKTGEVYSFDSLFSENSDYKAYITDKIIENINKDPSPYFDNYAEEIKSRNGDFSFFIDGNLLVVYFGQYEISPYAAGMSFFAFDADDLKDMLKSEVYQSLKEGRPSGSILYNGNDIQSKNALYEENYVTMVPLRDVAEALGYTVDWNERDGAIVAGGFIKNETTTYSAAGKEPVTLGEAVVLDGVTYVPIDYFTLLLEENVTVHQPYYHYINDAAAKEDKPVLLVYSKTGYENYFDTAAVNAKEPTSPEECVKMYAEAAKNRDGVTEYMLYNEKLREESYKSFSDLNFVSRFSSPWIESYDIEKIGDNVYKVTNHVKTSAPEAVPDEIITLTLEQSGEYWEITAIKEG